VVRVAIEAVGHKEMESWKFLFLLQKVTEMLMFFLFDFCI
jgi:hypothetical protein